MFGVRKAYRELVKSVRGMQVAWMTYYGNGCWTAESEEEEFSDNLGASLIVWRKKVK